MEMYCSDNVKELATAMLKVQSEITGAIKDAENPFARSKYASLNSVVSASRSALLKHEYGWFNTPSLLMQAIWAWSPN